MIENYSEDMPDEMKVSPQLQMLQKKLGQVSAEISGLNDGMMWLLTLQDMLENRIQLEQEILNEWMENQKSPKS